jgi:hypothetical protein
MAYLQGNHYCAACGVYLGPDDGDGICSDCDGEESEDERYTPMLYTIISETDLATFKDKIRQRLEDGWEFQGNLCLMPIFLRYGDRVQEGPALYVREMVKAENRR